MVKENVYLFAYLDAEVSAYSHPKVIILLRMIAQNLNQRLKAIEEAMARAPAQSARYAPFRSEKESRRQRCEECRSHPVVAGRGAAVPGCGFCEHNPYRVE